MSKKLIKLYKGVILQKLHSHANKETYSFTLKELDEFLKDYANVKGSCSKMTLEELKDLVEWSLYFGNSIGCTVDYPTDELDKQINLNIK